MPTTSLALYLQTQRALYAAGLPDKVRALEAALRQLGGTDGASGQACRHRIFCRPPGGAAGADHARPG